MLYSDIFLFIFISTIYVIKFSIYLCSQFFFFGYLLLYESRLSLNPVDLSPQLLPIREGLLYVVKFSKISEFKDGIWNGTCP
jgi:hypothetical protein